MFFNNLWLYLKENIFSAVRTDDSTSRQILFLRIWQAISIGLAFSAAMISLRIGTDRLHLIYTLLGTVFFFWLATRMNKRVKFLQSVLALREDWGKPVKKNREFQPHSDFFELRQSQEDAFFIDERTWQDLDMDTIFTQMDRTLTMPGEQYLYYLLHKPEFQSSDLLKRNHIVNRLIKDENFRHSLQQLLSQMGRDGGEGIVPFIWDELPSAKPLIAYRLLHLLSMAAIGITTFYPTFWLFTVAPVFIVNMFVHYREKKRIYDNLGSLFYLGRFLASAKKISRGKTDDPELAVYYSTLKTALKPVKKLASKTSIFVMKNDPIAEYFFIIFLTEIRTFYKVIDTIRQHKEELKQIYTVIGELDAYLSIGSYRAGLSYYSEPQLDSTNQEMQVADLYHPLLSEPVSHSYHLQKRGALITGSNMSGKSTMLRAVGINALLSQTIYTSLSKSYQANYYKILTSIGRSDNVITGDSYYLVEAKALKRIIEELGTERPILCIVDEIFRGTNSLERIAASAEVLKYLSQHNCVIFAATHDLELTGMLEENLHNFHFKETVNEKGLFFDYQLRPGPSTTRNAINLLEFLDYPASVIAAAREAISKMEKKTALLAGLNKNNP